MVGKVDRRREDWGTKDHMARMDGTMSSATNGVNADDKRARYTTQKPFLTRPDGLNITLQLHFGTPAHSNILYHTTACIL